MKLTPAALLLSLSLCTRAADFYDLDPSDTRVGFDIDRFGLHWVSAHFRDFHGEFVFDRAGADSRVDVTVQTDSIDCGSSVWNPHLRSPEWLDTRQYPQMIFRSHHIQYEGETQAESAGELTLHGVTHPIVFSVSELQCPAESSGAATCRFTARASVKRSDYGLPHSFWTGGDQVQITISGTGMRTPPPNLESAHR